MSLTGSLFSAVSGLNSQGTVLGVIGDNIANISTVGFKQGNTTFSSLVTGSGSSGGGSGVIASSRLAIDQQGQIQSTGVSTDIAISGQGFFVVKDNPTENEGEFFYTRAGSFRQDDRGFFVNSSGFVLQAYKLDPDGKLPGETGNADTTPNQLLQSLTSVSTREISGIAFATSTVSLGVNLDAGESVLAGSGDTIEPPAGSIGNTDVAADDIIAPDLGTAFSSLTTGDELEVVLGNGTTYAFTYGGYGESQDITADAILGSSSPTIAFTPSAAAAPAQLAEGDNFTISTSTLPAVTFTYQQFNPEPTNASARTFNSLATMAQAIDAVNGLSARVVNNRLYVSSADAREAVTFTDVTGNIVAALDDQSGDFSNIAAVATNRFNTLQGLTNLVNDEAGITASVTNPTSDTSVRITVDDPLQTIQFRNATGNTGDILQEFALASTAFDPIYNASGTNGNNMSSGTITPSFSRNIRVFDSLGSGHDLQIAFAKAGNNKWLVEVFASNPDEITNNINNNGDGQLASGTILFNGDGTLSEISAGLTDPINVGWTNGAEDSAVSLNLGTPGSPAGTPNATSIGLSDGLSQFNGPYTVQFVEQNGAGSGLLSSLEIDSEGFVIANFSNGQSRRVFKIPLAAFPNSNGLSPKAGNVYQQSDASGEFTLSQVGDSGVGVISIEALESANTELANELTKLIVAQRAFQANTKIITTADELLDELNRI